MDEFTATEQANKLGYEQGEKDAAKEILKKVKSYTFDKEVGLRYLINQLAKEYGVEI